jgi:hypothetical protein
MFAGDNYREVIPWDTVIINEEQETSKEAKAGAK